MSPLSCPQPFIQPGQVYRMSLLENSSVAGNSRMKEGILSFRA